MGNEEKPTSKEEYEKILDTLNHFESGCQGFYDTTYVPFKELTESQLKSICDIVPSLEVFEDDHLSVKYKTCYSDHLKMLDMIKDMIKNNKNKKLHFYNIQRRNRICS